MRLSLDKFLSLLHEASVVSIDYSPLLSGVDLEDGQYSEAIVVRWHDTEGELYESVIPYQEIENIEYKPSIGKEVYSLKTKSEEYLFHLWRLEPIEPKNERSPK